MSLVAFTPLGNFVPKTGRQEVTIRLDKEIAVIRPELHGHFAEHLGSCIYGGLWVGKGSTIPNIQGYRKLAVEYLQTLRIPVLRWPGGCFADDYHWRDGIGPPSDRPKRVNLWWGQKVEDNSFGIHEFIGLCRLLGAAPYIAGNLGSGSPEELRDWVEYCNYPSASTLAVERAANGSSDPFQVRYWGVGNESWACGGHMTPEEYAALYSRYATYVRPFGGTDPYLVAVGPESNDVNWTKRFFTAYQRKFKPRLHGFAMHYYSWGKSTSTKFTVETMEEQLSSFAVLEKAIIEQRGILDSFEIDPRVGRVGLIVDEWGTFNKSDPEDEARFGMLWMQNTMRDAVAAGLGLNVFHRQADKLAMCNIAQVANVLQAMILTHEEHCIRTPTYYAFELCKDHCSKTAVAVENGDDSPLGVSVSASRKDNVLVVTAVNPRHDRRVEVQFSLSQGKVKSGHARALHHGDFNSCNTFDVQDRITPTTHEIVLNNSRVEAAIPPLSVVTMSLTLT